MAFDSVTYRRVLGQFATGVTLLTTTLPDGRPWAMTANSFTSVSLDPPIVLVSVGSGSRTNNAIRTSGAFAVSILRAEQIELARRFSRREQSADQFADLDLLRAATGAPIIPGGLGWVDCRLGDVTEQGDHTVFFGGVEALHLAESPGDPLLYYHSAYVRIEPDPRGAVAQEGSHEAKLVTFNWEGGNY